MSIENIEFEAGALVLHRDAGPPTRYPISEVIRLLDIPTGITYTQVAAITALANLIGVVIRTLIHEKVLSDNFLEKGDLDLETIIYAIEQMGGDYGDPDLDGSER